MEQRGASVDVRSGRWRAKLATLTLLLGSLLVGLAGTGTFDADADELLKNGDFEAWSGGAPGNWQVNLGSASPGERSVSGTSLYLKDTGSNGKVSQIAAIAAGSSVSATVSISMDGTGFAELRVVALTDGFVEKNTPIVASDAIPAGNGFTTLSTGPVKLAPGTAYVRIEIVLKCDGPLAAYIDAASAQEIAAPPTPTPTSTPTEGAEATSSAPTPTQGSGGGAAPTATRTKAPTKTPTPRPPTKTPTSARPPKTPTPNLTPTPSNPDASMSGLLLNGDFEALDNGKPAYWAKYGGEMGATAAASQGQWAATLTSETTSTKWLSQVVPVSGGSWYQLTAMARAENATAFLRVSWYESADGSGSAIGNDDGNANDSDGWARLITPPIQAPDGAQSARIKLMLSPKAGSGRVSFDDAWFTGASAPPATPTPSTGGGGATAPTASGKAPTATRTAANSRTATPKSGASAGGSGGSTRPGAGTISGHAPATVGVGPATLRLSEFMSDPPKTGSDTADEWVEVVNVGAEPISTAGWQISDAKSAKAIPAVEVPGGGYLVIAARTAELPPDIAVARVIGGTIGSGLNNAGDVISLIAPDGTIADTISYGDNTDIFEPPPPAPPAGKTLGSRDPAADQAAENWAVTLAPSPGKPNTFAEPPRKRETATPDALGTAVADSLLDAEGPTSQDGLSTLDWILIGGMLAIGGAAAPAAVRRFGTPLWKRVRRGR